MQTWLQYTNNQGSANVFLYRPNVFISSTRAMGWGGRFKERHNDVTVPSLAGNLEVPSQTHLRIFL